MFHVSDSDSFFCRTQSAKQHFAQARLRPCALRKVPFLLRKHRRKLSGLRVSIQLAGQMSTTLRLRRSRCRKKRPAVFVCGLPHRVFMLASQAHAQWHAWSGSRESRASGGTRGEKLLFLSCLREKCNTWYGCRCMAFTDVLQLPHSAFAKWRMCIPVSSKSVYFGPLCGYWRWGRFQSLLLQELFPAEWPSFCILKGVFCQVAVGQGLIWPTQV